ncbi:MAG: hypothetical protein ACE369_14400 [Roseovarius sp.]
MDHAGADDRPGAGEVTARREVFDISFSVGTDITNFGTIKFTHFNGSMVLRTIPGSGITAYFRVQHKQLQLVRHRGRQHGTVGSIGWLNLSSSLGIEHVGEPRLITGATTGLAAGPATT